MRNLTIQRKKSIVASLIAMHVYIEDYNSNEITINNTPCRKIGELKNGEQKSFQIGEERAKIFVIADKLSKNYCSEFYEIPAGIQNVFLTGKNKFNIATGNAFRFDNNNTLGIDEYRKKGRNLGLIICVVALIGGYFLGKEIVFGLFDNSKSSQTGSSGENFTQPVPTPDIEDGNDGGDIYNEDDSKEFFSNGISFTLTNEFKETSIENYAASFQSNEVLVLALEEKFSLLEGLENYTLDEYGQLVMQNSGLDSSDLKSNNDIIYFEYDKLGYHYFVSVYKSDDAFWLVHFATPEENSSKYSDKFVEWARLIEFY